MKKTKKLLSILLAATMTLAMAAPTFADDPVTADPAPIENEVPATPVSRPAEGTLAEGEKGDGAIRISNTIAGETYKIYRIFDLESFNTDKTAYAYTISSNSEWFGFVRPADEENNIEAGTGAGYVTLGNSRSEEAGETIYYVTPSGLDDDSAAAFAQAALAYAEANHISATGEGKANEVGLFFTDLPLGYYLVDSSVGILCSLNTTDPTATISEKNSAPSIDKQVQSGVDTNDDPIWAPEDEDRNTANIGDTVNYQVVITARKGAENYVLHDNMSTGLTFSGVTGVTMNNESVDRGLYDVVSTGLTDDCDFELSFKPAFYTALNTALGEASDDAGVPIVISYTAVLNENAVIAGDGNTNTAGLEYGDGAAVRETPTDTTTTYTYEFDLVKTTASNTVLTGAKFELYNAQTGGEIIALVTVPNEANTYRVATEDEKAAAGFTSAVIEAGNVVIRGLGKGEYWLEETEAPAGYNKLAARERVTIDRDNNKATVNGTIFDVNGGGVQVINNTGTLLPGTGGIGTTIFYAAGIILMAGAVFFVVRRKRA